MPIFEMCQHSADTVCWCCDRYAVPALLPMISTDLQLADSQGAALTVGYTVRWDANSWGGK